MSEFFLNLGLPRLEDYARMNGFVGANWKGEVLADVAPTGSLRVVRSHDPRSPSDTVWHVHGSRSVLHCIQDKSSADTLFAIGLVAAPRAQMAVAGVFPVPGPWGMHTFGRRGKTFLSATDHLVKCEEAVRPTPTIDPHHPFAALGGMRVPSPAPAARTVVRHAPARLSVTHPHRPGVVATALPTRAAFAVADLGAVVAGHLTTEQIVVSGTTFEGEPEDAGREHKRTPPPAAPREGPHLEEGSGHGTPHSDPLAADWERDEQEPLAPEEGALIVAVPPQEDPQQGALEEALDTPDPKPPEVPGGAGEPLPVEPEADPVDVPESATWDALAGALVRTSHPQADGLVDAADPEAARLARIAALEAQVAELNARLAAVPSVTTLLDLREAMAQIIELGPRVAPSPPPGVRSAGPGALAATLAALAEEQHLSLPRWVFAGLSAEAELAPAILASAELQQALRAAVAWVRSRFGGAAPRNLSDVQSVADDLASVEARLERAWQEELAAASVLDGLRDCAAAAVRALDREARVRGAAAIRLWEPLLSPAAMEDLCRLVVAAPGDGIPDATDALSLSPEDRDFLTDLGTFAKARSYIARHRSTTGTPVATPPAPPVVATRPAQTAVHELLDLDHVVTDDRHYIIAGTVVVPEPAKGASHVIVDLPVRVIADGPMPAATELIFRSPAFAALPRDLALPGNASLRTLSGSERELVLPMPAVAGGWREIGANRWAIELALAAPLRLATARELRDGKATSLSLALRIGDRDSRVTFTKFTVDSPAFSPGGSRNGDTPTILVKNRPLGVQLQHEKLERHAREGAGAFMVVAPRRFGKTILFEHLGAVTPEAGRLVVTVPLKRDTPPAEAAREVWSTIRQACETTLRAAPPLGGDLPDSLTDPTPWRVLASFLAERGTSRALILVDEAQSLVPRRGGQDWGNAFKPLSESLHGGADAASIQIGLFGTVDLAVRMGQNCRDALLMQGVELYEFEDDSLVRYLKTVGQGQIQSSKFARQELARWGNNLRTLIAITDRIGGRVKAAGRSFFLVDDVLGCVDEMLNRDQRAADEVWKYARSELSHADNWDPIDAFPLAVAWANVSTEGTPIERLERCRGWLEAELRAVGATAFIPTERMETALRDLKDRGVLRGNGAFYRPFLEGLLRANRSILRDERESQMALLRAAVDVVPWPDAARQRAEGGQARIYVVDDAEPIVAYRSCSLDSDEKRRRFVRTCAAIRSLKDKRTAPHVGDAHLPRVRSAGFREDDPNEGLVVYHWVEGEDMLALWERLAAAPRAHVVGQIAKAIAALHERDVVHCDVTPWNIVVDGKLKATLIDFGLARPAHHPTVTRLDSDIFKAPEQSADPPVSGKPCDVYALGMLLMGPDADMDALPPAVVELANRMVSDDPAKRPGIGAVVEALATHLDFEPRLHELKAGIEAMVRDAPPWLWEELLPFAGQIALVRGRVLPWDIQRALEVALMLNNIFVRSVSEARGGEVQAIQALSPGKEISLNLVSSFAKDQTGRLSKWGRPEVRAVGLLRIALAHPSKRKDRIGESRVALGVPEAEFLGRVQDASLEVARFLDGLTGLKGGPVERLTRQFVAKA
jgi:tRNA A-37 threonylcarbamoyl transferase component Bud32